MQLLVTTEGSCDVASVWLVGVGVLDVSLCTDSRKDRGETCGGSWG